MQIQAMMDIINEARQGRTHGTKRAPKVKPGREVRDGVLCYDGRGPSGYSGRCAKLKVNERTSAVVRDAAAKATARLEESRR